MQSAVLISAWIPNPTALPFGRLAQRGGASTGKSQQRFIRVSPKGMGERAPQEDDEGRVVLMQRERDTRALESVRTNNLTARGE
jgi:hypothetical protein